MGNNKIDISEITINVAKNDLERATKLLIDFANETGPEYRDLLNEAVIIRSNFLNLKTKERQIGYSRDLQNERNFLSKRILELSNEIGLCVSIVAGVVA